MIFGFFSRWKKAGRAVGLTGGAGKLAYFDNDGNVVASDKTPSDIDAGGVPSGGTNGQVLTKTSGGAAWQDVPEELPNYSSSDNAKFLGVDSHGNLIWAVPAGTLPQGENVGDVLMYTFGGPAWQAIIRIPGDGTAGQYLKSLGNQNVEWANPPGGSLPASTSSDEWKVLTVDSNGDPYWEYPYDYGAGSGVGIGDVLTWLPSVDGGPHPQWQAHNFVPSGGSNGQVLTWNGNTYSWATPSSGTTKYLHNVMVTVYDASMDTIGRAYMSYVSTSSTASTSFGTLNAALVAAGLTGSVPATGFISAGSGISIIDHLDRSGSSYYFAFATYPGSPDNVGIDLGGTGYFSTAVSDYVVALS